MALQTLRAFFLHHLRFMYSGEHQLAKTLPKVLQGVASQEVKSLIREYQLQVEERCERLETVSTIVTENLGGERCGVMEAFTKHAVALSEIRGEERVLDLAILTLLRQVGHFEKSSYEIVRSLAEVLEESEVLKTIDGMLSQTEENERSLILLTEDMMDSLTHAPSAHEYGVFRVVPRDLSA
jgi:ferritin-like metal-binding protein YciE